MKNFQTTLPKAVPQHYTSVEYLDGPPLAIGGVVQINYNVESNSLSLHVYVYVYMYILCICTCVFVCISSRGYFYCTQCDFGHV